MKAYLYHAPVLAFLAISCGPDQPDDQTFGHEITFAGTDRAAHHDRWYRNRGFEEHQNGNALSGQRDFQLASAVRAAGLLYVRDRMSVPCSPSTFDPCLNSNECFGGEICNDQRRCELPPVVGSSTLVGDGLLATAHHVVDGTHARTDTQVMFDGVTSLTPLSAYRGLWMVDDPAAPQPFGISYPAYGFAEQDGTDLYSAGTEPEEALGLPERMFQLSLHGVRDVVGTIEDPIAPLGQGDRVALRRAWSGVPVSGDFFPVDRNSDFAFVEVRYDAEKYGASFPAGEEVRPFGQNLGFGEFVITTPGVLFNQIELSESEVSGSGGEPTPAWATHFNAYPFPTTALNIRTPLVSDDGQLFPDDKYFSPEELICGIEPNGMPQSRFYKPEGVQGEISALAGSSGGGMLTCPTRDCAGYGGDGQWTDSDRFAPLKLGSVISVSRDSMGASNQWNGSAPYDANSHFVGFARAGREDDVLIFSPYEAQVQRCEGPECLQSLPACADVRTICDETENCYKYCKRWDISGDLVDSGLPATKFEFVPDETGNTYVAATGGVYSVDCDRLVAKLPGRVVVQDTDGHPHEMVPGGMIGLRGFPSRNGGIGTFKPVCSIWDPIVYYENWRWLRTAGPSSFTGIEPILNHSSRLRYALNSEYFVDDETESLRPAPMKLCPPNYYLYGLGFRRENGHLAALEELECMRNSSALPVENQTIEVPLLAPGITTIPLVDRRLHTGTH
ncbi:MAG: hypothetical protein R3E66_12700 [bacterium]